MCRLAALLALANLAPCALGARDHHADGEGAEGALAARADTAAGGDDDERTILARGLEYISQPDLDDESRAYLMGTAPPILKRVAWADVYAALVKNMPETGVSVDDHKGTPIGEGDSIGLVAARFSLDPAQVDKLPREFRTGLFGLCGETCPSLKAAVRVSHTNAADLDLMRVALKIHTEEYGDVDFHFTETVKTFPIKDLEQLRAFTKIQKYGTAWALIRQPLTMGQMASQSSALSSAYADQVKRAGSLGKDYYSLTPYRIGAAGPTAGAFKVRLVAQQTSSYPEGAEQEYRQNMRSQFVADVQRRAHRFSFEIQVATSARDHPVNDCNKEWDETSSPWVRMGAVEIPQQSFASPVTVGNVVGSGLWVGGRAQISSKELVFIPGSEAHAGIGDINAFRSYLYPLYDRARQEHLLGKSGGAPARCPWAQMMNSE